MKASATIAAITRRYTAMALLIIGCAVPAIHDARAATTFSVTFSNDVSGQFVSYYPSITSNVLAAAQTWLQYFSATNTTIVIEILFVDDTTTRSGGSSLTSHFVETVNGTNIFEQAAATKLRTGFDQNGTNIPDMEIELGTNYLVQSLWFDPNPLVRTDVIPSGKRDAMSVFLHELCHGWAFNGWINGTTGAFPGNYMSTFDQWIRFDGLNFFFIGPGAEALYGAPVPLTYANVDHLGNNTPRPGSDLIPDLMNGIVFTNAWRYYISSIDLAMCADAGVTMTNPPVVLLNPHWSNGNLAFNVACPFGRMMRIDWSINLVNWTALTNIITTNSTMTVSDPAAGIMKGRFYRAALQ